MYVYTGRPSLKDQKKLANTSSTLTATIESSSWGTTSSKWSSAEKRDQPVPELSTVVKNDLLF